MNSTAGEPQRDRAREAARLRFMFPQLRMPTARRRKPAEPGPACWACGRTVNCPECAERRKLIDDYAAQSPVTATANVTRRAPEPGPGQLRWQYADTPLFPRAPAPLGVPPTHGPGGSPVRGEPLFP